MFKIKNFFTYSTFIVFLLSEPVLFGQNKEFILDMLGRSKLVDSAIYVNLNLNKTGLLEIRKSVIEKYSSHDIDANYQTLIDQDNKIRNLQTDLLKLLSKNIRRNKKSSYTDYQNKINNIQSEISNYQVLFVGAGSGSSKWITLILPILKEISNELINYGKRSLYAAAFKKVYSIPEFPKK